MAITVHNPVPSGTDEPYDTTTGAGTIDAGTQRMALATDGNTVQGPAAIGDDATGNPVLIGARNDQGKIRALHVGEIDELNVAIVAMSALPAGSNPIGSVELGAGTLAALETINAAGPLTDAQLRATAVPVSAASLPLPSGAATSAKQDTAQTTLAAIDGHVDGVETLLAGGLPAALGSGGGVKVDGSGTALPVSVASLPLPSGAATSAKQDTIIGHVDGLEALLAGGLPAALAAGGGLKVEGVAGGVAQPVSAASLPLPSGAATSAKQDTVIGHLDGVEGLLTTINAAAAAIQAAVETLDNAIAGSEMQADVLTLPADPLGANADAIVAAGAVGSISAKLRRLTQGVEDLKAGITALPSHAVTNAGTFAVQDATAQVSLSVLDDWDESDRAKVNPIAGQAGVAAGAGAVGATTQRTTLASDDPAVTALQVMDDWDESDRAKVNPIAGQAGVQGGAGVVTALTQRVALATDANKIKLTDGTLDLTLVDETGAAAVDAMPVGGGTPHDAVDSGNPVKMGWKAASALPTAVAANDRANGLSDLFGRQLVSHIDPAMQVFKSYNDTSSRAAGSAQVVWDPTSGKKIAVTNLVISAYGTTAGRIFLFFADDADLTYSAGTDQPLFVGSFAPTSSSKPGVVIPFSIPIVCTTADRRLHYQNDAAISVDITVYGYEF